MAAFSKMIVVPRVIIYINKGLYILYVTYSPKRKMLCPSI